MKTEHKDEEKQAEIETHGRNTTGNTSRRK
jgi:hypothetical protein